MGQAINSSEYYAVMIAYTRVGGGHFMDKGGPVCKEKFEGIYSSGRKVDNLGEVEVTQEVKESLVNFDWVPVTADDLISPIDVREIEITPAPKCTA